MKKCRGCPDKGLQPIDDFYAHKRMADGHLNYCKVCVLSRTKKHYDVTIVEQHAYEARRNATPERRARLQAAVKKHRHLNPAKYAARTAVGNALRDGRLFRRPCACGSLKVQAHHADYSKPLDVKWACFKCHREQEHGQIVTSVPATM